MSSDISPAHQRLIHRLDTISNLTNVDRDDLAGLPIRIAHIHADEDVIREGDRTTRSFLLIQGFIACFKITGRGKRQILSFHVPGEIPDLLSIHLEHLDCGFNTLTQCTLGFIEHEPLRSHCERNARVAAALWRATLIDAAIFREWVTNIGQRDAASRMAHVFCEMFVRLLAMGLVKGNAVALPLTQVELADATGMSAVHANRTLQELRATGLIGFDGTRLDIRNWDGLRELGDFDPAYLHLKRGTETIDRAMHFLEHSGQM